MKLKVIGLVSALAIMAATGVQAQTANSQSNSTSGAAANSGSQSGAAAISRGGTADSRSSASQNFNNTSNTSTGVTLNQTSNNAGQSGVNYSGGTSNYSTERSTGDVTVRTTPTVYAPPVSGGNPCTLAVSGGVSVIGWGAAAGGTFVDEDCATRQKIAMIHNAGYPLAAKELMCNDRKTYYAFRQAGQACAYRQEFEAPGAPVQPMVQQQPGPVVVTPPVQRVAPVAAKEYPKCDPRRGVNDNCRS